MPQQTRTQHRPEAGTVASLEVELTLLARHHLHSRLHADRNLDRSGYQLLSRLEREPLSLRQLAEAFRLDQSTVNRQVNALLRAGLVERTADPAGGLARLLRPTATGLEHLRRDRSTARRQLRRVLDGWSPDDAERLRILLERFNTSIEELEGRSWPRG